MAQRYTTCPNPDPQNAVLEADNQPAYDTILVANGDRLDPVFTDAIGSLGSIFGAAVRKTRRETSFKRSGGVFASPQMFDAYAGTASWDADIAFADMVSIRFQGRLFWRIGEKTFLELPFQNWPGGIQLRTDQLAVPADSLSIGEPLERNTKDFTVNEVAYDKARQICFQTGNVVPVEMPAEQGMEWGAAFDDPATGVVLTANRFLQVTLLGVLKREVL